MTTLMSTIAFPIWQSAGTNPLMLIQSTIFLAAIVFRLSICFPIKVYQEHLMAKLVNLRPEITEALEKSLKNLKKDSIFMSPEIKRKITRQVKIFYFFKF